MTAKLQAVHLKCKTAKRTAFSSEHTVVNIKPSSSKVSLVQI